MARSELEQVDINNLKDGEAARQFATRLSAVLENIDDPNTLPETVRTITMTFAFKPTQDRRAAHVLIKSDVKLAPNVRPEATVIHIAQRQGKLVAAEFNPAQMTIAEALGQEADILPHKPKQKSEG